ncbi:MAG: hypothetical protein K2M79_07255 [Muribaculaceae bacterium]|nr:hypothetical protein [Muribaculaceae bacterium]
MEKIYSLYIAPELEFVRPYIQREMESWTLHEDGMGHPQAAVCVTSAVTSAAVASEFKAKMQAAGVPVTTLECAHVVGTGMTGLPRKIAELLYRGRYMHIRDINPAVTVIHATEVAALVARNIGRDITLIAAENKDTTVQELAEALNYRLGDKVLPMVSERKARWLYSGAVYQMLTESHTVQGGTVDKSAVKYMRTHVYDENSL